MAAKVLDMHRPSFTRLIEELKEEGPKARGVIAIWLDSNAHFRVSGFDGQSDGFFVVGLLEWIKSCAFEDINGATS